MFRRLLNIVQKDLKVYLSDRRAVIISLMVPIAIASFLAVIFGGVGGGGSKKATALLFVDQDNSPESLRLFDRLKEGKSLAPERVTESEAKERIASGKVSFGVVVPKGFGAKAMGGMMGGEKASLNFLFDPSKSTEAGIYRGPVIQSAVSAVLNKPMSDDPGPIQIESTPVAKTGLNDRQVTMAHAFAGMAVQGILFGSIELAMGLIRERQRGFGKRLRSAPFNPIWFLLGRWISGAVIAMFVMTAVLIFGVFAFKIPLQGSLLGLGLTIVCSGLMSAGLGLLISSLGRTEPQSRGLSVFIVLFLNMVGGAWFPSFLFPEWVQTVGKALPSTWAVNALDAMTWRGQGLSQALLPSAILLGFAVLFVAIASRKASWEPVQA
jgi:ABC-2 type transport system permease protein